VIDPSPAALVAAQAAGFTILSEEKRWLLTSMR
jgi:hypothetical protein